MFWDIYVFIVMYKRKNKQLNIVFLFFKLLFFVFGDKKKVFRLYYFKMFQDMYILLVVEERSFKNEKKNFYFFDRICNEIYL